MKKMASDSGEHTYLQMPEENENNHVKQYETLWDTCFVLAVLTVCGLFILYASDAIRSNAQLFFKNASWPKIVHF